MCLDYIFVSLVNVIGCIATFFCPSCFHKLVEQLFLIVCMEFVAKPLSMTRTLVVEGGWLTKPWIADVKVVDNHDYIMLHVTDRSLAKALGMDLKANRSQLGTCKVFDVMQKLRNEAVDQFIVQAYREKDPMAERGNLKDI